MANNKVETFVKNLRWRTFFFLNPDLESPSKKTYGFNSTKPPPSIPELKDFEDGLALLIENIKFRSTKSNLQCKLKKDLKKIKSDNHLFIPADKTNNYYKLKKEQYEELLTKCIQKEYKKSNDEAVSKITAEDKTIAERLDLSDRIDTTAKRESFITLKDHKPNFRNKPTCRLINPCKPELGRVSKQIVENIVHEVKVRTQMKQWRNTGDVVNWFNNIKDKTSQTMICFDICDFYPSISSSLLQKSLTFASQYTNITEEEIHIITHTKKTTLYKDGNPWTKKSSDFDVTMGSFDGAEVCELVGLYLLSQLQHLAMNVGLYRDDGLAITNKRPRAVENMKKEMCQIFKDNGLNITIDANKKVVDFLDITLDLRTGSYKPYKKPNDCINYIHKESNHPPAIINNLPKGIEFRLSNNSSDSKLFEEAVKPYNRALKENGHRKELKFTTSPKPTDRTNHDPKDPRHNEPKKKIRRRNITWFNPPFSKNVATNVGNKFFTLLSSCFPPNNKLHKIINKNTVKLSYSCMNNVQQIINSHNKTILTSAAENNSKLCNCREKNSCPLNGKCLQKGVVYQATVVQKYTNQKDTYIGITENEFKTRYNQHTSSFRLPHKKSTTTLSEHVWNLKNNNIEHCISWEIIENSHPYNTASKKCNLCTAEKYFILTGKPTLNKRREIFAQCPHRRKHLLQNIRDSSTARQSLQRPWGEWEKIPHLKHSVGLS